MTSELPSLSLEGIERASAVIDPVFTRTPQWVNEGLSREVGTRLVVKAETCNPIRSFKGRGTDYFLHQSAGDTRSIVTVSAGNFGQGLAYAGRRHGVQVVVYTSTQANPLKIDQMRALGADVRVAGDDFDDVKQVARAFGLEAEARFVEDGAVAEVAEGAGTIGKELAEGSDDLDVVLVPVGNGALITGVARWLKHASPQTRVVGVCAAGAPCMQQSFATGRAATTQGTSTVADGIAVRIPVQPALRDLQLLVDDVVLVDDATILDAVRLVHTHLGLVVEPAGVVGVAALLASPDDYRGAVVATPLCGGNAVLADLGL
jgi:threonine dehydratase